jgi:FtsP/CotA-like multicopper oxidase with cupredoxin domain
MDTVAVEFYADNPAVWFIHGHIAYHMATGIARLFQYTA